MIHHQFLLAAVLVGLVAAVRAAARTPGLAWAFKVTPAPFWCYVLPMLGTTAGWWPSHSPLYPALSQTLLPICLGLLLLGTDLPALARLSRAAAGAMLAGSVGIMSGMVVATWVWGRWLPAEAWQGLGALAGSWTGGSMNLLAVKEALGTPDTVIAPVIVTDTVVAYTWMAGLLILSAHPLAPPRLGGSSPAGLPGPGEARGPERSRSLVPPDGGTPCLLALRDPSSELPCRGGRRTLIAIGIAIVLAWGAQGVGQRLPAWSAITAATWTVLLVTTAALLLSLTPLAHLGRNPAVTSTGTFLLYVLLASIGARVDVQAFRQAPVFLAAGVTAVAVHGAVLVVIGWRARIPRGLLATASQANIGGVVSAPLVGAAYDRSLAPLGLLLAVLGNVIGTYAGLLTAALCRAVR